MCQLLNWIRRTKNFTRWWGWEREVEWWVDDSCECALWIVGNCRGLLDSSHPRFLHSSTSLTCELSATLAPLSFPPLPYPFWHSHSARLTLTLNTDRWHPLLHSHNHSHPAIDDQFPADNNILMNQRKGFIIYCTRQQVDILLYANSIMRAWFNLNIWVFYAQPIMKEGTYRDTVLPQSLGIVEFPWKACIAIELLRKFELADKRKITRPLQAALSSALPQHLFCWLRWLM